MLKLSDQMVTHSLDNTYGVKISGAEYDRRIVTLHLNRPPRLSKTQAAEIRRAEMDIAIDHRLGVGFPREKRDALWAVQQKLESTQLFGVALLLLGRKVYASWLARLLYRRYASALTPEEMAALFHDRA